MHEQLEQWLAETEGPERDAWLIQARQHWQEQLMEAQSIKSFTFNKDIFRLFAVDLALLNSLQQSLMELAITKALFNIHRPMMVTGERSDWDQDVPPVVRRGILAEIGRILGGVTSLKRLHFFQAPFPVLITIIGSCSKLEALLIVFSEVSPGSPEQLTELASSIGMHQTSLTDVSVYGIRHHTLRAVFPMLSMASELNQLLVHGYRSRREEDPIRFETDNDAAILCRLLKLANLRKVDLDHIKFSSLEALEVFFKALGVWQLDRLRLGGGFVTPDSAQEDLVKATADSCIRQLRINDLFRVDNGGDMRSNDDFNHSALVLFADFLVKSTRSTMEDLYMRDPRFKYWTGVPPDEQPGLHHDWAANILRALDLNRDRRTSIPIFERFQQTHAIRPRFADVFAVRPTIIFEQMRSDRWDLLSAIDAYGPGVSSAHVKVCRQLRR